MRVLGMVAEFCTFDGEVTERLWVPLGTKDFGSIIAVLRDDIDAIYLDPDPDPGSGSGDALLATGFYNAVPAAGQSLDKIGGDLPDDHTVHSEPACQVLSLLMVRWLPSWFL